ncbi:MAG: hypothetical protein K2X39_05060, partial [Silvanigrellaceae bacterium]|nr:hypothetical protein [Silvanigrellaceae bacterium]
MKFIKIFILVISLSLGSITPCAAEAATVSQEQTSQTWQEVLKYAQENLPLVGQLKIKPEGFSQLLFFGRLLSHSHCCIF